MTEILFEDNHLLVAVKPPNLLSQADATGDPDMLTMLKGYLKEKYRKPGNVYLGLVHRLDRPVGGLMVFARTSKAAARLSADFAARETGREYICVVTGKVEDNFTLTDYLVWDSIQGKVVVCEADTKDCQRAVLHGRCIERRNETALCAVRLETGRKHQIRAQMSNIGAPLWGDNRYGPGIPGQQIALWCCQLTFRHPVSRLWMSFHAMPYGGIWGLYQDLLTVPDSTKSPEERAPLNLSEKAAGAISAYAPFKPEEHDAPAGEKEIPEELIPEEKEEVPFDTF